jgi:hypothetical protein
MALDHNRPDAPSFFEPVFRFLVCLNKQISLKNILADIALELSKKKIQCSKTVSVIVFNRNPPKLCFPHKGLAEHNCGIRNLMSYIEFYCLCRQMKKREKKEKEIDRPQIDCNFLSLCYGLHSRAPSVPCRARVDWCVGTI